MKHPEFKLFPWGVLAVVMPVIAFLAALGYDHSAQAQHDLIWAILLSTLAAGNAYVVAIAGGRLGQAVLSIPVGAVMGIAVVPALSWQPAFVIYMLLLCVGCIGYTIEYLMYRMTDNYVVNGLILIFATVFIGTLGVGCLSLGGAGLPATSPWAVPLCYPVVMSSIGAAMVVRTCATGAPDGFLAGFKSAVTGQLRAVIFLPPFAFVLNVSGAFNRAPGAALLMLSHLMLCNYFTLRALFPELRRVTDARSTAPVPLQVAVVKAESAPNAGTGPATEPHGEAAR